MDVAHTFVYHIGKGQEATKQSGEERAFAVREKVPGIRYIIVIAVQGLTLCGRYRNVVQARGYRCANRQEVRESHGGEQAVESCDPVSRRASRDRERETSRDANKAKMQCSTASTSVTRDEQRSKLATPQNPIQSLKRPSLDLPHQLQSRPDLFALDPHPAVHPDAHFELAFLA